MSWLEERDGYQFYQDDVETAISEALNLSAEAAHKWFEDSEQTFSVSVENFCQWVKEYLDSKGPSNACCSWSMKWGSLLAAIPA